MKDQAAVTAAVPLPLESILPYHNYEAPQALQRALGEPVPLLC